MDKKEIQTIVMELVCRQMSPEKLEYLAEVHLRRATQKIATVEEAIIGVSLEVLKWFISTHIDSEAIDAHIEEYGE